METARDKEFSTDFSEVVEFYNQLRARFYKRVGSEFPQFMVTPITYKDCVTADGWASVEPRGRRDWFWSAEYHYYRKAFKRFDIAFKNGNKLVGLSYGVPTRHKTGLKIDLIESTPFRADKLGMQVFELISFSAQFYAGLLGAEEVRIMKPTSEKARSHYCAFGYDYVSNAEKPSLPDYCVMKLR